MATQPDAIDQLCSEIDTTLALADADKVNISYALLKIVEKAPPDDQPRLLQHIAENFNDATSSKEIKIDAFISENEKEQLKERYGGLVDKMLEIILADRPTPADFYQELHKLLNNPLFREEKTRAFSLYWLLIDKRIPYFQLPQGIRMSDDDWGALSKKLRLPRARIRFILASKFQQRSEEADLLLRELDAYTGPEKVRLMGYVLWRLRDMEKQAELVRLLK